MKPPNLVTLLDLLQVVNECTANDTESVAAVAYLINSGKVLLCGNFAGARIDLSHASGAPSHSTLRVKASREMAALLSQ